MRRLLPGQPCSNGRETKTCPFIVFLGTPGQFSRHGWPRNPPLNKYDTRLRPFDSTGSRTSRNRFGAAWRTFAALNRQSGTTKTPERKNPWDSEGIAQWLSRMIPGRGFHENTTLAIKLSSIVASMRRISSQSVLRHTPTAGLVVGRLGNHGTPRDRFAAFSRHGETTAHAREARCLRFPAGC